MKTYTIIFCSFILSLVGKCDELRLRLSTSDAENSRPLLKISLENHSSEIVVIPVILIPEYSYMGLDVFGPDGSKIEATFNLLDYKEDLIDLVRLRSLDSYSSTLDLSQYFESVIPKGSRVIVRYNLEDMHPKHLEKSTWSGVLSAEIVL